MSGKPGSGGSENSHNPSAGARLSHPVCTSALNISSQKTFSSLAAVLILLLFLPPPLAGLDCGGRGVVSVHTHAHTHTPRPCAA